MSPGRRWVRLVALRLLGALGTVAGATALLLALLFLAPGDPIDTIPNGEALRPQLTEQFGLDRPPAVRWAVRLGRALVFDLGTSYVYRPGAPVAEVVARPAVRTVGLVAAACALAVGLGGLLAGITAGRRSALRPLVQAGSLVATFVLADVLVSGINDATWWALQAGWIERPAWFALPDQASLVRSALAVAILAGGSGTLAEVHAELEDALVRIRSSPWVDAARARGRVPWGAVLRAMVPAIASTLSDRAALLVGGALVVEHVLLMRGVGDILWQAARLRDYDLALAIALLSAVLVAGTRLLAEAATLLVDPRLRGAAR
ncbi:MAG: ABC transporter permease subunit [Myxococcota bacterium]